MTNSAPDMANSYRLGVGIVLFNPAGLVFVGRRIDTRNAWQMPQGGIDKDEEPRAAALRELEEETGTCKAEIIAESSGWLTYDLPGELAAKVWKGRYRGQKQKWFAMRFLGQDSDFDLNRGHPEFEAWRWSPLEALTDTIVDFKRPLYDKLLAEFADLPDKIRSQDP